MQCVWGVVYDGFDLWLLWLYLLLWICGLDCGGGERYVVFSRLCVVSVARSCPIVVSVVDVVRGLG